MSQAADFDPKKIQWVVTIVVVLMLGILAYYVGSHRQSFSVLKGANTHEEEVALQYYRTMVCVKCPDDSYQPLWQRYSGKHCAGRLSRRLVVLHSDGDGRIEDIFTVATNGLPVISKIVGGRPPSWVHDTPSVWCFTDDSLYRYAGEMCVDGIRRFASGLYAAEWVM